MAIKTSKGREANAAAYKNEKRQEKNRVAKLTSLAKKTPNNPQLLLAIKNVHYRRGTPKTEVWSHSDIRLAKLVKHFSGKFSRDYFSVDPIKAHAAAMLHVTTKFIRMGKKSVPVSRYAYKEPGKSMFSIGVRAGLV